MRAAGVKALQQAREFKAPADMTIEEIEAEVLALIEAETDLRERGECPKEVCDGQPHRSYPWPHARKVRVPKDPISQAKVLDPGYRARSHLSYLAERLAQAVRDVEGGESRYLIVSMPPRMGKSHLTSIYLPTWLLRCHPDWKIGLISHSPHLATTWGRQVRRMVEEHPDTLGIGLAKDAGAVSDWETTEGGGISSRSAPGQSITGLGFKVMLIDDPVKDYAAAHSKTQREALWDWWKANAVTRLEPPSLVVVIGTRWHEDDLIGRLLNPTYDGDPDQWEVISFPALAEDDDVLGRTAGEPLISPIVADETPKKALKRWAQLKKTVGSYAWAALYQQRPAPAEGAIFDMDTFKFWTRDPNKATEDGKVVYLNPEEVGRKGTWLDSWDLSFKGSENSDYVVGQRWVRVGANRYLIAQQRGQWTFTQTIKKMLRWAKTDNEVDSPYGSFVHRRLVEDAANGPAIMDQLKDKIAGLKPVNPKASKEARARAVSPEIESGNVFLPYTGDKGNEWVQDLLGELRNFPNDTHDDQVDSLTQGLANLRDPSGGKVTNPDEAYRKKQAQAGLQGPNAGRRGTVSAARTVRRRTGS